MLVMRLAMARLLKMSKPIIPAILCLAATGLAGCANGTVEAPRIVSSEAQAMPNDLQSIVAAAKQDAVARGAPAQGITVQSAQRVTWRDGSLGCPEPQMQYTQALVPGWRGILRVGDAIYDYHAAIN
ncbi:MAG TPA: hypothetical protein VFQ26_02335, partial [Nitrospiraceae bacterium]|nr:hypothetical protein [Nitrospiraceae bacterium]